jgi:hypothetical protein
MKTRLFTKKIPELVDYVLAIAVNSVPGIAEVDGDTKQLYQSIAKQLLAQEVRSTRDMARRKMRLFRKKIKGKPAEAA